jgi:hypothetical protein
VGGPHGIGLAAALPMETEAVHSAVLGCAQAGWIDGTAAASIARNVMPAHCNARVDPRQ